MDEVFTFGLLTGYHEYTILGFGTGLLVKTLSSISTIFLDYTAIAIVY